LLNYQLESDESIPEYLNWLLKSKGLRVEKIENSDDKIEPDDESVENFKIRELEQTKELLMGLTKELLNKIESVETKKESESQELKTEKSKDKEEKEESKIVFSDLTWYRNKLNGK